jgi:hypothetical protein
MPGVFGKGLTYSRQIVIARGKIFAVSGQAGKPKSLRPARIFLVLAWGFGAINAIVKIIAYWRSITTS